MPAGGEKPESLQTKGLRMWRKIAVKGPTGPFSTNDVGKAIEINGGEVCIDGEHCHVQWAPIDPPADCSGVIESFDPAYKGLMKLDNGNVLWHPLQRDVTQRKRNATRHNASHRTHALAGFKFENPAATIQSNLLENYSFVLRKDHTMHVVDIPLPAKP